MATTRTVAVGGWPGPGVPRPLQHSITVATKSKILRSNPISVPQKPEMGAGTTGRAIGSDQPVMAVKIASEGRASTLSIPGKLNWARPAVMRA